MTASHIPGALALGVLFSLAACEDTEKLAAIQRQADERVTQAQRAAAQQVDKLRNEMAELRAQYDQASAQAKAAAAAAIEEARSDADARAKEAEKALARAREAYKAEGRAKLKALEEDRREVRANMTKLKGKLKSDAKSSVDKLLKEADALEKEIGKNLSEFDKAGLSEFRAVKAQVSANLAKLKAKIAAAAAKLPKA